MANPTVTASAASDTSLGTITRPCIIANDDANRLYVLLASGTASATNYTFSLAQHEYAHIREYRGVIKGIWAGDGSGNAYVTEIG